MRAYNKLAALITCCAMLAAPTAQSAAETRKRGGQVYHRTHYPHHLQRQSGCPVHRNSFGELMDCHGWRLGSMGWDNTCFNLGYLPSQFACTPSGGLGL